MLLNSLTPQGLAPRRVTTNKRMRDELSRLPTFISNLKTSSRKSARFKTRTRRSSRKSIERTISRRKMLTLNNYLQKPVPSYIMITARKFILGLICQWRANQIIIVIMTSDCKNESLRSPSVVSLLKITNSTIVSSTIRIKDMQLKIAIMVAQAICMLSISIIHPLKCRLKCHLIDRWVAPQIHPKNPINPGKIR